MLARTVLAQRHASDSALPAPCCTPLGALVGRTPLIAIQMRFRGERTTVHAKAEFLNLTGSIKDRMAQGILSAAKARGDLAPGQPIVEATSGNAGIALAALGRALGHPVTIF
ncbi:MAG: pyridoxal-phosphate dependent enzyme, partial [Parasphingopyxis sp.]|uniref:pyridoxal-phosphate dependent enzyme n=1 Tax=Parasphingopyxis sp. TaxID=1920299 RepID=UPI003FA10C4A